MINKLQHLKKIAAAPAPKAVDATHADLKTIDDYSNYARQAYAMQDGETQEGYANRIAKDQNLKAIHEFASTMAPDDRRKFWDQFNRGFSNTQPGRVDFASLAAGDAQPVQRGGTNPYRDRFAQHLLTKGKYDAAKWQAEQGAGGSKWAQRRVKTLEREKQRIDDYNKQFGEWNWKMAIPLIGPAFTPVPFNQLPRDAQAQVLAGRPVTSTWNPVTWGIGLRNGFSQLGSDFKGMFQSWLD